MAANLPSIPTLVTPGDLGDEMQSFVRHLRAQNVSPNTVYAYTGAVVSLGDFLMANDLPTDVRAIERQHIERWQESLLSKYKPATAHQRYRGAHGSFTGTSRWTTPRRSARRWRSCVRRSSTNTFRPF